MASIVTYGENRATIPSKTGRYNNPDATDVLASQRVESAPCSWRLALTSCVHSLTCVADSNVAVEYHPLIQSPTFVCILVGGLDITLALLPHSSRLTSSLSATTQPHHGLHRQRRRTPISPHCHPVFTLIIDRTLRACPKALSASGTMPTPKSIHSSHPPASCMNRRPETAMVSYGLQASALSSAMRRLRRTIPSSGRAARRV